MSDDIPRGEVDKNRETDFWRNDLSMKEVQIKNFSSGNVATVNEEGRLDVVQHAHPNSTTIHFNKDGLTTGTYRYILIDISNTGTGDSNYKHVNTDYIHVEWLRLGTEGSNTANYSVNVGFLENVDATDGDRYFFRSMSATKKTGQSIRLFDNYYPNGHRLTKEHVTTHLISMNDANWADTVSYGSSLNPAGSYNPGSGDVVVEVVVAAGTVDVSIDMGYHGH